MVTKNDLKVGDYVDYVGELYQIHSIPSGLTSGLLVLKHISKIHKAPASIIVSKREVTKKPTMFLINKSKGKLNQKV